MRDNCSDRVIWAWARPILLSLAWSSLTIWLRMTFIWSMPTSVVNTNFQASSLPCLRMRTLRSISASLRDTLRDSNANSAISAGKAV